MIWAMYWRNWFWYQGNRLIAELTSPKPIRAMVAMRAGS
jgi:hypothetical protein